MEAIVSLRSDCPGLGTCFEIPEDAVVGKLAANQTIVVNCRQAFKKLTGRKRTSSAVVGPGSPSSSDKVGSASRDPFGGSLFRSSNRFDSIIDKLERKYYHAPAVDDADQDSLASDGNDSNSSASHINTPENLHRSSITSSSTAAHSSDAPLSQSSTDGNGKRKRKKVSTDAYDFDDPFLDDTDEIAEYEHAIAAKRKKTTYFASAGDTVTSIDVALPVPVKIASEQQSSTKPAAEPAPAPPKPVKVRKPRTPTDKPAGTKAPLTQKSNSSATSAQSTALPSSATTVSSTAINTLTVPPTATTATTTASASDATSALAPNPVTTTAAPVAAAVVPAVRAPVVRPDWQPAPAVRMAMDTFRLIADATLRPLSSSSDSTQTPSVLSKKALSVLPVLLEEPLLRLDATVQRHHSANNLNKTKGYYEFIQSCLGPGMTEHFTVGRIRATITRLQLRQHAQTMQNKVREGVSQLQQLLRTCVTTCPADKRHGHSQAAVPSSPAAVADKSMTEENEEVQQEVQAGDSAGNIDAANSSSSAVAAAAVEEYDWLCTWSIAVRQQLVQLLDLVGHMVLLENEYRNKLTQQDKKTMSESEYHLLILSEEQARVEAELVSVFPARCLDGDLPALKKAVKLERSRQKRGVSAAAAGGASSAKEGKLPQKKPQKPAAMHTASASTSASSAASAASMSVSAAGTAASVPSSSAAAGAGQANAPPIFASPVIPAAASDAAAAMETAVL